MFLKNSGKMITRIKKIAVFAGMFIMLWSLSGCTLMNKSDLVSLKDYDQDELIRFHVVANSDSDEDQLLKYAIRDEILKLASPSLAKSSSLEESRQIILEMEDQFLKIAHDTVEEWGKDYSIFYDHGRYVFPAKSYGDIVLPGGEYEAVMIQIGDAQGKNWWCVLFPPLCFVNVEESTTLPVDGEPGVPLDSAANKNKAREKLEEEKQQKKDPQIFILRFFR